MSDHVLGDRERALENAFFARRDQELLAKLRGSAAPGPAPAVADPALHAHLADPALHAHLAEAEVRPDMVAALSLVPLVLVAWADGRIDTKERNAVLAAAHEVGLGGHPEARPLLDAWLAAPPPPALADAWRDYVRALCANMPPAGRAALKHDVLGRARRVAAATGAFLGMGGVSAAEEAVLGRLEIDFDAA